jgi:hypothetical protein
LSKHGDGISWRISVSASSGISSAKKVAWSEFRGRAQVLRLQILRAIARRRFFLSKTDLSKTCQNPVRQLGGACASLLSNALLRVAQVADS